MPSADIAVIIAAVRPDCADVLVSLSRWHKKSVRPVHLTGVVLGQFIRRILDSKLLAKACRSVSASAPDPIREPVKVWDDTMMRCFV